MKLFMEDINCSIGFVFFELTTFGCFSGCLDNVHALPSDDRKAKKVISGTKHASEESVWVEFLTDALPCTGIIAHVKRCRLDVQFYRYGLSVRCFIRFVICCKCEMVRWKISQRMERERRNQRI